MQDMKVNIEATVSGTPGGWQAEIGANLSAMRAQLLAQKRAHQARHEAPARSEQVKYVRKRRKAKMVKTARKRNRV